MGMYYYYSHFSDEETKALKKTKGLDHTAAKW